VTKALPDNAVTLNLPYHCKY